MSEFQVCCLMELKHNDLFKLETDASKLFQIIHGAGNPYVTVAEVQILWPSPSEYILRDPVPMVHRTEGTQRFNGFTPVRTVDPPQ